MSFVNDFKRWVRGEVDDDDYELDDEEMEEAEQEESSEPEYRHPEPVRRAMPVQATPTQMQKRPNDKVVNISATTRLEVVLIRADQFKDVGSIADHLKAKQTVVLNMESTDKDTSRRTLDFLSGVAYALEGKIKRVARNTYLITPIDVDIVGDDLISELENNGMKF